MREDIVRHQGYYKKFIKNTLVYRESSQHVTAVTKLMRVTKEDWFEYINKIIHLNNYRPPLNLNLKQRLNLFKTAFTFTLKKHYPHFPKIRTINIFCCPNCHSNRLTKNITVDHFPKTFTITICSICNLGIQYPIPTQSDIDKIYQSQDYFSGNSTKSGYYNYSKEALWRLNKAKKYLNKVLISTKLVPQSIRALDIGCGYGYFLKVLKDKNIKSEGLEVSTSACEYAKTNYQLTVFPYDLNNAINKMVVSENTYDLITMWDVIEHFSDIDSQINMITKLLKPGGFIALRTNNIDSIESKIFGQYFHSIKNEHLFYFSPKSLDTIFNKHGYKRIKCWTHTHIFLAFMSTKERNEIDRNNQGGDIFYICQKK